MQTKEKDRASRRRTQPPKKESADVTYLPAKTFNRNRFLLRMATVVAVVLAVILGISVFFKVETVKVSGCKKYTAWDVMQASGVETGENLLTFNRSKVSGRIMSNLPFVKEVHIGISLPGTVNIQITEIEVTYAVKDTGDGWWLVSSAGKVVAKAADGAQDDYTKILGLELDSPKVAEQAVAKEVGSGKTDADGNTVPVTVTQAQRLATALDIAVQLEANGIIGKAASIDVTKYGDIELWYGKQYQVLLGDTSSMKNKIALLKGVIADPQYSGFSGVLDITMTTRPDGVLCYPFGE